MKNGTVLEKTAKSITKASVPDLLFNSLFLQQQKNVIRFYSIEKEEKKTCK